MYTVCEIQVWLLKRELHVVKYSKGNKNDTAPVKAKLMCYYNNTYIAL